ncbi:PRC-barrel domain-containing protein [Paracoccus stylophorae]|uniref:PRC-barrel domain-containing protein n=1 Tax=Paracoccus stylophorae TaxID=659350 RepID=A0ABY7T0J3_9RHOB|nr:PRC-barrel domain-containing protein [Paracoccus stylophorae]WCR12066.1 PRC-barrel domain-containing protein [Paracoccus stylophorae]
MRLTTSIAALMLTAAPVLAQDAGNAYRTMDANDLLASEFIGSRIYTSEAETAADMDAVDGAQADWEDLGEVNDLVLSRDGSVSSVLLDIGGFLGMGEKRVAVNMDQLKFMTDEGTEDPDDYFIVLPSSREALEQAPAYMDEQTEAAATDAAATDNATVVTNDTATDNATVVTNDTATTDPAVAPVPAAEQADADNTMVTPREGYTAVALEDLTAEDLTGASLYGANDESIAEIEDLVLNEDGTTVSQAIVDVGGFLGIGAKRVALPVEDLQIMRDEGGDVRAYVGMTKEEMEQLPEYEN